MCLAIPAKVIRITGNRAEVLIGTSTIQVGTQLMPDIQINDHVLIHAGYILEKIDAQEALQIQDLLNELQQGFFDPEIQRIKKT
jgi:hydrogenase expression/formation protein HypC